ncbi:hypothetical protein N3919_11720 [Bosea minatitlanensis]|jgi:hypothetical protein|nr:hypothetical protein [Bosea minatitlanensis]
MKRIVAEKRARPVARHFVAGEHGWRSVRAPPNVSTKIGRWLA